MNRRVPDDRSERHLIDRVRRGDAVALRLLFERHAPGVHRLAFRLLGSRDDADDIVQDVFVGLRVALVRYTDQDSFEFWLRRVATRTALMRIRGDRRRDATARASKPGPDAPDGFTQSDPVLGDALSRVIAALPDSLRLVFVLRMIEDYSYDDIAQTLGLKVGACKVRLSRALRRLRPQLSHLRENR